MYIPQKKLYNSNVMMMQKTNFFKNIVRNYELVRDLFQSHLTKIFVTKIFVTIAFKENLMVKAKSI